MNAAAPVKAAVLSIGTELTRGTIHNTNATWLCGQLTSLGARIERVVTVDDDSRRIQAALSQLAQSCELVVCTGGLGPTTDDLTAAAVAELLKVPLKTHQASLRHIQALVERRGRALTPSNARQADLPEGALALPNGNGTAPGFVVSIGKSCDAYFLPGVPAEMQAMFDAHVAPIVAARARDIASHQEQLRVFGLPESAINDTLAGLEHEFDVSVSYRVSFPEVLVGFLAARSTHSEARAASDAAANEAATRLGDCVYARGETTLVSLVGSRLQARSWTLGLAESCTGGLAAELVTREPASHYFVGGVVCYANQVKQRVLHVRRQTLDSQGAVSEATVAEMAENIREVLECDVGLAFSGIAGPSGGTELKPVGLVHYGVCTPEGLFLREQVFTGDRGQIQQRAAFAGFDLLRRVLE